MKPNLSYLLTLLLPVFLLACSADDGDGISEDKIQEFVFNGETYNLVTAIISDENTSSNDPSEIGISLFNKTSTEVTGNEDLSDINFVYFNFVDVSIQNTTYNQIEDYDISTNGSVVDSEFNPGTILLSDSDPESDTYAQSGSVTVTNFTEFNIAFTFTFTRNDGQVISGSYDGNYLMPDL